MSSLSDIRTDLVALIQGQGLAAKTHIPGGMNPPVVLIFPSDPYLERGDTYERKLFQVNYDLILFSDTASNFKSTSKLDEMIERVLSAVTADFHLVGVGQPDVFTFNQANYLGAIVQVQTMIELTG